MLMFARCVGLAVACLGCVALADDLPPPADRAVEFLRDVRPLLAKHCVSCHGPEKQESGLRLDQKKRAVQGGDSGPAWVAGKSGESRLIRLVAGLDKETGPMPPEGEGTPLARADIAVLRAWIDQGAAWPDDADSPAQVAAKHWAFQPVKRPGIPVAKDADWPRNPIDQFVARKLAEQRPAIRPSAEAGKSTLVRRLFLDLLGLPPSPEDVREFLEDSRPDAYERLVDRLLGSPAFGERWGRHWLDLARYADSDGYEKDQPRPNAWRYRQWVIEAINADLPFDQFTIEQLAGDLLPDATTQQRIATGFHRNTLHNTEGGTDQEEDRVKKTVDRTNTLGTTWLGLTVGCSQCHSHKYDPLTQREYFSLYAFFNSLQETDLALAPNAGDEAPAKKAAKSPEAKAPAVSELAKPRETRIHRRGDFLEPGDKVSAETPQVLPPLAPRSAQPDRLDLARWLMGPDHPLVARVTVNRIWQRYFGRGLTPSSDDFGTQGDRPSHPELLDWLAAEFRDSGWQVKRLHKLIVTSATYRQSSAARPDLATRDPENVLLARHTRRRVEAEIVRDLALAASGLLDARIGGPSVRPPQPTEYAKLTYAGGASWPVSTGGDAVRRGLYTFFQRTSPYPMLATFDAPDSNLCLAKRTTSNTPLQALTVWNDPVFFECAQSLGRRIVLESPSSTADDRAGYAVLLALGRPASADEVATLVRLASGHAELLAKNDKAATAICGQRPRPEGVSPSELAAWIMAGRVLLNLDEFVSCE